MPFSAFHRVVCVLIGALLPLTAAISDDASSARVSGGAERSDSAGVWAQPHPSEPGRYADVELNPVHAQRWDAMLDLHGAVVSSVVQPNTVVYLRMVDESGQEHSTASIRLPLEVGANPFTFSFTPEALAAGRYEARFQVIAGDYQELAEASMAVRKLDGRVLRREIDDVAGAVEALRTHLDAHGGAERHPYEQMRVAAVEQLLPTSRRLIDGHSLLRVDDTLRYMNDTLDSVRATLTFGESGAQKAAGVIRPDMTTVVPRDGAFYAGNQPVFLFGFVGGDAMVDDMGLLSRLGLNFALVNHGARGDGHHTEQRLGAAVEQAQRHNMALSVQLAGAPEAGVASAADAAQTHYTHWPVEGRVRPGPPQPFITDALAWLSRQPIVRSAGIANRPRMQFRGEEAREAFVAYLRESYPTRHDLNRSWKMRVRTFDEVTIEPDSDRIAYRHDWHRFSRGLGAEYAAARVASLEAVAPSLPLYLTHGEVLPVEDGATDAKDLERIGLQTPITGVSTRMERGHPRFAMDFPGHVLPYVLLRSMIPGRPVLDAELHLALGVPDQRFVTSSEDFVHAGLWDAAIEGLNGAAVWAWTRGAGQAESTDNDLIEELGALEGLARASTDLNRLGDIVVAFQRDHADTAILYSHDSLIRPESAEYRKSLAAAFEGVSFGGRKVRFITEQQVAEGGLDSVRVLVLPRVRALPDEAYNAVSDYIEQGGIVIRTPNQIPYDGRGHSRPAVIVSTLQTVLVRGQDSATSYFHAIEAAYSTGLLPEVPRLSNEYGYLLEGVKSRFVEVDGEAYLYLVNLRQESMPCSLNGPYGGGFDLIQGRTVTFPTVIEPLDPMLIRLGTADSNRVVIAERTPTP